MLERLSCQRMVKKKKAFKREPDVRHGDPFMTCCRICGPKRLDKNGGERLTPETPNLIRRDKLITMTDERLFTSPQRKAAVGQKKEEEEVRGRQTLLIYQRERTKGGRSVWKGRSTLSGTIASPANAAAPRPSAPARAPTATLIHAAMTEARRQMSPS